MDHRDLLKRYIRRVADSEGCTFIPNAPGERTVGGAPTVDFTPEEIAELKRLEEEGEADEEEERRRYAATIAFLEEAGIMDELRERVREGWRQVEDRLIHGDGTAMPYGILSRAKGYICGEAGIRETLMRMEAAIRPRGASLEPPWPADPPTRQQRRYAERKASR